MLYRYFIGTGETDIISVEQVYELYQKGMISKTSKLYDVDKNIYVEAYEVPEFIDVFLEKYSNESKATKLLKYMVSTVFFLMFLLINMINAFLKLCVEKIENNTTNFLLYMIGIFLGMTALIALIIFVSTKFFKRHSSILVISSSIIMFIISSIFLVITVRAINIEKSQKMQIEKAALVKIINFYESGLSGDIGEEDIVVSEYGDFAPLVSETQKYVLSLNQMNVAVDYLFKGIPLSQIIKPDVLSDTSRMKHNRESAQVVISGLTESKAKDAAVHDTYVSKIENLAIPESVREEFVLAIKKNCELEKKEKDELYDLNIKLFEKIDELLKYFEERTGRYNIVENWVVFNEKTDEDGYNKLIQEYETILKQYNEAVKISLENDQSNLEFLKDLVEKNYQ